MLITSFTAFIKSLNYCNILYIYFLINGTKIANKMFVLFITCAHLKHFEFLLYSQIAQV